MLSTLLKRSCAVVLICFVLAPTVAARDDEISILSLLFNTNPFDDSVSPVPYLSKGNYDCDVATLLWRFDARLSPMCIFEIQSSSAFLNPTIIRSGSAPYVTPVVGRAPPAAA